MGHGIQLVRVLALLGAFEVLACCTVDPGLFILLMRNLVKVALKVLVFITKG
jgi:hypothetical protein